MSDNTKAVEKLAEILKPAAFAAKPDYEYYAFQPKGQSHKESDRKFWEGGAKTRNLARRKAREILEAINAKPADYLHDNRLGVAMGLLRDNIMQFNRELNQAELDLIQEAKGK